MTELAFTPGPWSVHPYYYETEDPHFVVGLGPFDTVAEVRNGHDEIPGSVEANAHLIAESPNLYAALAELDDALTDGLCNSGLPDFDKGRLDRARDQARDVLAKAQGIEARRAATGTGAVHESPVG